MESFEFSGWPRQRDVPAEIEVYPMTYKGVNELAQTLTNIANGEGRIISVVPSPANKDLLLVIVEQKEEDEE